MRVWHPYSAAVLLLVALLAGPLTVLAIYDVPNNDAGCPANCRQIPWLAGADVWNGNGTPGGGTLPMYTGVACTTGLTEGNGTVDNTAAIQACLNNLDPQEAAVLPPGMYYVDGTITVPSNAALRGAGAFNCSQGTHFSPTFHGDVGAGATCTTLKYGPNGTLFLPGSGSRDTPILLASGYTKGSTSLTTSAAHGLAIGNWIVVAEQQGSVDPPVTWVGESGNCTWCGVEDNDGYLMSQVVKVTAVPTTTTLTLSRPLYYTFQAGHTPRIRQLVGLGQRAGVESLKLWGSSNARTWPHIRVSGCMECWASGVETYNTPDVAKAYPIYMQYAYGMEVRDSYFHFGQGNGSDRNYGMGMFGPNSDHKVENNIYRENRHGFSQEGGGSGNVFLYNYIDDNYTDDLTYLGATYTNHGAHPYMTLVEGNIVSKLVADNAWGSSSHMVLFRNWLWGDESGFFPAFSSSIPDWGFVALHLAWQQWYYAAVGNVLGITGKHTSWSTAQISGTDCLWPQSRVTPRVYGIGCGSLGEAPYDAAVRTSTILHGNYDYTTQGVAFWDGGGDHVLKPSMYYPAKPAWFGAAAWPLYGPDLTPIIGALPAQTRFMAVAPQVRITAPASGSLTTATSPLTTLAGTGLDDLGITSLTWVNDRGGSGTTSCATCGTNATDVTWSVPSITLQPGVNLVTVTAHGRRSVQGTATLSVTYQTQAPPGASAATQFLNANMVIAGFTNACDDSGTANAYACTPDSRLTAYMPLTCYSFKAASSNTGASTLNLSAIGPVAIQKFQAGTLVPLVAGDIPAGKIIHACYDGTLMQCQNCGS